MDLRRRHHPGSIQHNKKVTGKSIVIIAMLIAPGMAFFTYSNPSSGKADRLIGYFRKESLEFSQSAENLYQAIGSIDSTKESTIAAAKDALRNCRLHYKRIAFFLEYFFPNQAKVYNAPAKYEIEEPFMEYEEPQGLQQIESLLFVAHPAQNKKQLSELTTVILESANDLDALLFQFTCTGQQVLESLHIELIRIMSLYIAGYDAPLLKSGIPESEQSMESLLTAFVIYSDNREAACIHLFNKAIQYLKNHPDFDSFNRLAFLSQYALPLERALNIYARKKGLVSSSIYNLDYTAPDLLHGEVKPLIPKENKLAARLGKKLFSEKMLSGNGTRSCASCHQPDKFYTDRLIRNFSIDSSARLSRNTPSLLYAAYQSSQFWDGRVKTISEQIKDVIESPLEMNGSVAAVERKLNEQPVYKKLFRNAFNLDSITINEIARALSAYLKQLSFFNSAFDNYFQGDHRSLTPAQQKGFNLFMGKAQCGTCHFIPLFNGTTPPLYTKTEFEVLGVPAGIHGSVEDSDEGRYAYFPVQAYRGAFKTPTLRNVSQTAPYMHNGVYPSLKAVLDFYNRGGGAGLGLPVSNQTLPSNPLRLTAKEMKDIVLFLNALSDRPVK